MAPQSPRILMGIVTAPQGVRGDVCIRSFAAEPEDLFSYAPLTDKTGDKVYEIEPRGQTRGLFIAAIKGCTSRDAAERLRGTEPYVARDLLPEPGAGSYYNADLIGLEAVTAEGTPVGTVESVQDFGGGVNLVIKSHAGKETWLPFRDAFVPTVDLEGGKLIVVLPEETA